MILATSFFAPLWYCHAFITLASVPDDALLPRAVGVEVMDTWKGDELVVPGRKRSGFWAHVHRLVGSTQVAKCLINYGLSNIDSLSAVLHEVIEHRETDVHRELVKSNANRITPSEIDIRSKAKWFKYRLRKARKQLEKDDVDSREHVAWLDPQCDTTIDA